MGRQRTLVYMVIEWDDAQTTDPRKWEMNELIGNEFGEKVTDVGTQRFPARATKEEVDQVMTAVQDASIQAIAGI